MKAHSETHFENENIFYYGYFPNEILEYSSQWAVVVLLCFVQNALSKQ